MPEVHLGPSRRGLREITPVASAGRTTVVRPAKAQTERRSQGGIRPLSGNRQKKECSGRSVLLGHYSRPRTAVNSKYQMLHGRYKGAWISDSFPALPNDPGRNNSETDSLQVVHTAATPDALTDARLALCTAMEAHQSAARVPPH